MVSGRIEGHLFHPPFSDTRTIGLNPDPLEILGPTSNSFSSFKLSWFPPSGSPLRGLPFGWRALTLVGTPAPCTLSVFHTALSHLSVACLCPQPSWASGHGLTLICRHLNSPRLASTRGRHNACRGNIRGAGEMCVCAYACVCIISMCAHENVRLCAP